MTPASGRPLAPRLLALGLALIALVGVVSSISPSLREPVLGSLFPEAVRSVAAGATLATSVALLIVAGGLVRQRRRSWQAAVVMLSLVAVLHVIKGFDVEEAIASLGVLFGLVVWRRHFDVEGDPETPRTFRRHLVGRGRAARARAPADRGPEPARGRAAAAAGAGDGGAAP